MRITKISRRIGRFIRSSVERTKVRTWQPYSRLFLVGDGAGWSLDHDLQELANICRRISISVDHEKLLLQHDPPQCAFFAGAGLLCTALSRYNNVRITGSFFHGQPGTGNKNFDARFDLLKKNHTRISRIQVTNTAFRDVILETGISPQKVQVIPIGINLGVFRMQTADLKRRARKSFEIPQKATVVGSFQKDGAGWNNGAQPKLVKGPDIFLKAMEILKPSAPDLYVLLSAPARGYVKSGLERLGIPFHHVILDEYSRIGDLYNCLDLCLVASRDEGGPKSILESMASGVPLVSTSVGQATDLIRHGENGWLADSEDAEALAHWAIKALELGTNADEGAVPRAGRKTAEQHAYSRQDSLWRDFFVGLVSS